jgi:hypothetical protein
MVGCDSAALPACLAACSPISWQVTSVAPSRPYLTFTLMQTSLPGRAARLVSQIRTATATGCSAADDCAAAAAAAATAATGQAAAAL